jgi:hypothetical protein
MATISFSVLRTRCYVGVAFLLALGFAATAQDDKGNISGTWSIDNNLVNVTQRGDVVKIRFRRVARWYQELDLKPGNTLFEGRRLGDRISGRWHHYMPRAFKKICPAQWDQQRDITLELGEVNGHPILDGTYEDMSAILTDCRIEPTGQMATVRLEWFAKAPPPPEANANQPDLSGTWLMGSKTEMDVTQTGNRIVAKFHTVGTEGRTGYGFAPGDVSFTGTIDGHRVRGKFRSHFPIKFKTRCPEQWDQSHDIVLSLSQDQQTMRGTYQELIISADCSLKPWKSTSVLFQRPPSTEGEIVDDNVVPPERPPASDEKPHRIVINRRRSSAPVNDEIALWIGLAGRKSLTVTADRDYLIKLSAENGGTIRPEQVTIAKGALEGMAMVQTDKPGDVKVSASTDTGLETGRDSLTFCGETPIDHLQLFGNRQVASVDEPPILLTLKFVDKDGKPTHGNQPKAVDFQKEGIGELNAVGSAISRDFTVKPKECVGGAELKSTNPGQTTVTASFANVPAVTRVFEFYVQLGCRLLFWAALGGIAGGGVRIFQGGFRRRSVQYYAIQLSIGVITGITFLLACYFGLLPFAPSRFPSSFGIALLLGIIGGYLGAKAIDIVARQVAGNHDAKAQEAE